MSQNLIDEFGRDLLLRNYGSNQKKSCSDKLKNISWADFDYEEQNAEEAAEKKAQEIALKLLVIERKILYLYGKYQLEDGEIIG